MAQKGKQGINPWLGKVIPKDRRAGDTINRVVNKHQKKLIKQFVLPQRCSCCGESRQRKTDLLTPLIVHFINGDTHDRNPSNLRFFCYNCYFLEHPNKHKTINKEIGRTFEEQQDINETEITGDDLAKELGESLGELFGKN